MFCPRYPSFQMRWSPRSSRICSIVAGSRNGRQSTPGRERASSFVVDAAAAAVAEGAADAPAALTEAELVRAVAAASPEPGALRLLRAVRMSEGYHATYSTAWRRYAYFLPARPGQTREELAAEATRLDALLRPLAGATRDYSALVRACRSQPTGACLGCPSPVPLTTGPSPR